MTDSAISPIRDRITAIVADLNRALVIAREQGDPVQVAVVKVLGAPPTTHFAVLPPPEPPSSSDQFANLRNSAGTDDPPLPAQDEQPAGADAMVETCGLFHEIGTAPPPDAPAPGMGFEDWCRALGGVLAETTDLQNACGEAGIIPADFPEVWRRHFEAGRSPREAMLAHLVTLAPVRPAAAPKAADTPSIPEGGIA